MRLRTLRSAFLSIEGALGGVWGGKRGGGGPMWLWEVAGWGECGGRGSDSAFRVSADRGGRRCWWSKTGGGGQGGG